MSKLALVTGANTGIGKEITRGLAKRGMRVVLACRDRARGEAAREEIANETGNSELTLMLLDLADLASIRHFADEFREGFDRLDILVNNAGVSAQEHATTRDGFELVFGVNFIAPFLLTNLLLHHLKAAAPSRIVNLASSVHTTGHIDKSDPQMDKNWKNRQAYSNSKLADVLFTRELARRIEGSGVTANCYNPGLVRSEFFRNYHPMPFMLKVVLWLLGKSPEEGADTGLYLCASEEVEGKSGGYYEKRTLKEPSEEARDVELSRWLWNYAESAVIGGAETT
ncbi:MAG TPA: SDR family oxidoreductase [Spirochaetia bacterium]|nr:SDR family oxidoreductase [Spirochaetia bacterium]